MSLRNGKTLAFIINSMNKHQALANTEESDKVGFIDTALSVEKSNYKLPFRRINTTLRVFDGVFFYPFPTDYDELSFLDVMNQETQDRARFRFNSFNEFLENKDNSRNYWAEIFDDGDVMLGCRYALKNPSSRIVSNAESTTGYTASGDASAITKDEVNFIEGSASIRFTNTNSSNTATVEHTFTAFADANYQRKYYFLRIYLDAVPTSIALRFGSDSSNYLYKTGITTQFSGQALKADAWNYIAFDLNTASTNGTPNSSSFAYEAVILTGAATGTYYLDTSSIRSWELLDFWYYSKNCVQLVNETFQEYFNNSSSVYSTDSVLVGPPEWATYIQFCAMIYALGERETDALYTKVMGWKEDAEKKLKGRYLSVTPIITNQNWNFRKNFQTVGLYDNDPRLD